MKASSTFNSKIQTKFSLTSTTVPSAQRKESEAKGYTQNCTDLIQDNLKCKPLCCQHINFHSKQNKKILQGSLPSYSKAVTVMIKIASLENNRQTPARTPHLLCR